VCPVIRLGVDTLCWHLRLEAGAVALEEVLDAAAELESDFVQVNLHHVRSRELADLRRLAERAGELGLPLLASGDFLGQGRNGDSPDVGVGRVHAWLERAVALGSPILRVVSGFYRAELMGRPELIEAERRYVVSVLRQALPAADDAGVALLLENHSDFTVDEYRSLVAETGGSTGVFLDLINPIAALDDPVPVVRALAPLAPAGHVKDYVFESIPTDDGYHRRGFAVRYRYPGEGVADLALLMETLRDGLQGREFHLSIEGLDNRADVDDQRERLAPALALLRSLVG
jgi:sugar phosphate isomerase/epimerase